MAKRSGGPHSIEGKVSSSLNAITHGSCSRQLIVKGERQEEYDALEAWWFSSYEATAAGRPLLEEAVLNEWLLKRAQRNHLSVEARLAETDANDWTEEQFRRLGLMLRYKVAAERSFHRSVEAVERFRRTRVFEKFAQGRAEVQAEERKRRVRQDQKEKAEPEADRARLYKALPPAVALSSLTQYVTVRQVDGKTVTTAWPSNEELLAQAETKAPQPVRVFRKLTFRPAEIPAEYAWVEASLPGLSNVRKQVMGIEEWRWALEREQEIPDGHIGRVEPDPSWNFGSELEEIDVPKKDGCEDERGTEGGPGAVGGDSDQEWDDGDGVDADKRPAA